VEKMKSLSIILLGLLLVAPCVVAYTPEQQTTLDGMRLSFQLGMAYQQASQGQNVAAYNALVDQYNAFIRTNFGEDANLLIPVGTAPNLQQPYVIGKNVTNNGIVHAIDASGKYGPAYTTNDINQLPANIIERYHKQDSRVDANGNPLPGTGMGDGYLGGV
jgi:hypothetical protein